jgi:hypothetical protein
VFGLAPVHPRIEQTGDRSVKIPGRDRRALPFLLKTEYATTTEHPLLVFDEPVQYRHEEVAKRFVYIPGWGGVDTSPNALQAAA